MTHKRTQYEQEVIDYAISAYRFLIQTECYTYSDLAEKIAKCYDTANQRNKEVIKVLQNVNKQEINRR